MAGRMDRATRVVATGTRTHASIMPPGRRRRQKNVIVLQPITSCAVQAERRQSVPPYLIE